MDIKFPVPPQFRRGALRGNEVASVRSALAILALLAAIRPLAGVRMLDFGCGVKLVQALLQEEAGITRYVGLDVYTEMIDFLKAEVSDPRFGFVAVDFQNDMYNQAGTSMAEVARLPIDPEPFDLITMFSVITHMKPGDTLAILQILRRHAAPDSHLVLSAFVDAAQTADFVDTVPDKPLFIAVYRRAHLEDIIRQSGWQIEAYRPPIEQVIQHHYICRPAAA